MPTLQFNIKFKTQYGQRLLVVGNLPALGKGKNATACPMVYLNEDTWQLVLDSPDQIPNAGLKYKYLLENQDGSIITEWGEDRVVELSTGQSLLLLDTWNHAGDFMNAYFTSLSKENAENTFQAMTKVREGFKQFTTKATPGTPEPEETTET